MLLRVLFASALSSKRVSALCGFSSRGGPEFLIKSFVLNLNANGISLLKVIQCLNRWMSRR